MGLAAFMGVIGTLVWATGLRGRHSAHPLEAKSWQEMLNEGPYIFAIYFVPFFIGFYGFQRYRKRHIFGDGKPLYLCPECHTSQYKDDRRCSCDAKLESFDHWTWDEAPEG